MGLNSTGELTMKRNLILTLCVCFTMVLLQGCGKPKSAFDQMQGFKMVQEIFPTEDSDLLYLYSVDTDGNSIWRYDCSLNGNKVGEFHLGTYQIVRMYKEVGVHQLTCFDYGSRRQIADEHKYVMDERFTIKAEGNKKHYIEFNQGFMNVSSMKVVDGSNFKPDERFLTNNCLDCLHIAPKRFPKYE